MTKNPRRSFNPGDAVLYHHDDRTLLRATVLRPFDDGDRIQLDPPGPGGPPSEIASRILDETNEFFAAHSEEPLDYQDALFVAGERLRPC